MKKENLFENTTARIISELKLLSREYKIARMKDNYSYLKKLLKVNYQFVENRENLSNSHNLIRGNGYRR